jgi:hypothetical protein
MAIKPKAERRTQMAEVKVKVQTNKLDTKTKIVEEKGEGGVVVDRDIVTSVTIEYVGVPGKLDDVLHTLRAGHAVETFSSPQQALGLPIESKEEWITAALMLLTPFFT